MPASNRLPISARSFSRWAEAVDPAQWASVGLALVSLALSLWSIRRDRPPVWRFVPPAPVAAEGPAVFETVLEHAPRTGQAHSPAIALDGEGFSILWFEGPQEARAGVDIHRVRVRREAGGWRHDAPGKLLTCGDLGAAMSPPELVVTLGNTIQNEAVADGFLATVASIGGWAMAAIVDVRMAGGRPVRARKLNLSPVLNRSALVKSPMVACAGGCHALPAYFEMGATHGLFVRFDCDGRVRDARRMTGAGKPIQPMVVALSETRAVAFLRDFDVGGRLLICHSEDGGKSWSRVRATNVANPGSPVAALGLGRGRLLMALNDDAERPERLRLVLSEDEGQSWRVLRCFEDAGAVRYPMLRRLATGEIVLAYSRGDKRGVRAHLFNQAWVEAQ